MARGMLVLLLAMVASGCSVSSSSDHSREVFNGVEGPFKDVTLVDAEVSIVPPNSEARFPYHLDKIAPQSQLSMSWSGASTSMGIQGAGSCHSSGVQGVIGGSNNNSYSCGRLEPGDAVLVIKVDGGTMSGHVKLTAKEQA